jgi:hypothetical protein
MADSLTLGDLKKALAEHSRALVDISDDTPLVIVYDGGVAYSPVRKIEVCGADIAFVGY